MPKLQPLEHLGAVFLLEINFNSVILPEKYPKFEFSGKLCVNYNVVVFKQFLPNGSSDLFGISLACFGGVILNDPRVSRQTFIQL